eukprot:gene51930-69493_t
MTNSSAPAAILHSIADVERDTGLSKDILRVWERRYGFPSPLRDALGERQYDDAQLTRLRHIRRLIDAGHRPGRVVSLPLEALMELNTPAQAGRIQPRRSRASAAAARDDEVLLHWMQLLQRQDTQALREALARMLVERGLASWYGQKFHGRRTASGETYNMLAMTAAHKTMPIPSYARVRNLANGQEIIVRVNDRGPFSPKRVIDLSYAAAVKLGLEGGVANVEVERITHDEIRAGLPRREEDASAALSAFATAQPQ